MANEISNWVSLTEVINTVKLRMDLKPTDHYKVMSIATSLIQEFNLHYRKTKKSVNLTANGRQYVVLPDDYVDYLKIGFIAPNGEIFGLTKNDRISDILTRVCGEELSYKEFKAQETTGVTITTTETDTPIIIPSNVFVSHEKNFQKFTVGAGQTTFLVTEFVLTDNYLFFDTSGEQSANTSRVQQLITFLGAVEGDEITVLKLN